MVIDFHLEDTLDMCPPEMEEFETTSQNYEQIDLASEITTGHCKGNTAQQLNSTIFPAYDQL